MPAVRRAQGAASRGAILDRGLRLAAQGGLPHASIGALASALGMSKSAVFAHFGSKPRLDVAIVDAAVARFDRQVLAPAAAAPVGVARLIALAEAWLARIAARDEALDVLGASCPHARPAQREQYETSSSGGSGKAYCWNRVMATITGTDASNKLNGTNLADQIFGLAGDDVLVGFDGDDVLEGGAGADELFGSDGFDIASYQNSPTGVSISLADFVPPSRRRRGRPALRHRGRDRLGVRGHPAGRRPAQRLLRRGRRRLAPRSEGDDTLHGEGGNDVSTAMTATTSSAAAAATTAWTAATATTS